MDRGSPKFPSMNWFEVIPETGSLTYAVIVDGGGTHSRAALARADGTLFGYAQGGATSGRAVGNDAALQNLVEVVAAAITNAGVSVSDIDCCLVMSAAVDTKLHSEFLCKGLARMLAPFRAIAAVPDTLGCWAISNGLEPAVAVIAGTGSVVLVGDLGSNVCRRLGGWDFLLGDEGSGFGIGRAVLRETMLVGEDRSSAYELAKLCLDRLGIKHPDELPDRVTKHIDKASVASLAEVALQLAAQNDEIALSLVSIQVRALVELVVRGATWLNQTDLPIHVGQFGGLFSSSTYSSMFRRFVNEHLGASTVLVTSPLGAISGGLSLALWRSGAERADILRAARHLSEEITQRSVG